MKLLARSLMFGITVTGVLGGGIFGVVGAKVVADYIFGPGTSSAPLAHLSWATKLTLPIILSVGAGIGAVGTLAAVILPLHFAFPEATRPFSWNRKRSQSDYVLYKWYARKLNELVEMNENR
jgi:hypothetical protein